MKLRNVNFDTWLRSHSNKEPKERWLRELYPWPVFAQVEYDEAFRDRPQRISHDGVDYDVTLKSVHWQQRGTYQYRLRVESDGLGWHSRAFADDFALCASPDGAFRNSVPYKEGRTTRKDRQTILQPTLGELKHGYV